MQNLLFWDLAQLKDMKINVNKPVDHNCYHLLISNKTKYWPLFFQWKPWHAQILVLAKLQKGEIFKEKQLDILCNRDW